jgi:uncharacterized protein (DUF3084 family)
MSASLERAAARHGILQIATTLSVVIQTVLVFVFCLRPKNRPIERRADFLLCRWPAGRWRRSGIGARDGSGNKNNNDDKAQQMAERA